MGQIATIPHQLQSKEKKKKKKKKDQSVVVFLIYQSFGMSLVWVELIPRITRFIFPHLKNGLGLEFLAFYGQPSLETSTDTRLPKRTHLTCRLLQDIL
jgi:hypothetical protein